MFLATLILITGAFLQAPLLPELFFRKVDFSLIDKVHSTMAPERRPAGDVIECYKYTFGKTPGEA